MSEKTKQSGRFEAFIGFSLAGLGAYFTTASWRLPAGPDPSAPGPGVAPGLLGLALGICGIVLAVQALLAIQRSANSSAAAVADVVSDDATVSGDVASAMRRKPYIAVALLTVAAVLLEPLGFMLSTFLFLFAGFILLGNARFYAALSAAAITSVSLWLFFTKLLGVGLPFGRLVEILFY